MQIILYIQYTYLLAIKISILHTAAQLKIYTKQRFTRSTKKGNDMDKNTACVIMMFMFWGWIPILATGKSLSWIIGSIKNLKGNK